MKLLFGTPQKKKPINMINNIYHTDTNRSVEDTRPTEAPHGASAGAKAPAATSSSDGAGGWQVAGRRSTGGKTTRGKRGGRAHRKGVAAVVVTGEVAPRGKDG